MTTHTPGPWETDTQYIRSKGSVCDIARVYCGDRKDKTYIANAYLIAAAPELLAALELHITYENTPTDRGGMDGSKGRAWTAYISARDAAIRKAKGPQ